MTINIPINYNTLADGLASIIVLGSYFAGVNKLFDNKEDYNSGDFWAIWFIASITSSFIVYRIIY